MRGLVVEDKWKRVLNYQQRTLHNFLEIFAAAGCVETEQLSRKLIYKKDNDNFRSYEELYPTVAQGKYLEHINSDSYHHQRNL